MENCPFIDGLPIKYGDFPWKIYGTSMEHLSKIYDKSMDMTGCLLH